jgi:uncharacterized delta-60 repeat protein
MAVYQNTGVPRSLGVNQNTSTTKYKVSGEELLMLSGSLTATQENIAVTEGNENGAFYSNLGSGFDDTVQTIATQDDGRILVGGDFTDFNGNTRYLINRLHPDGTEDESFYRNLGTGLRFDGTVYSIAIQSDGGILVGGNFTELNGSTRNRLVRINDIDDRTFYNNLGTGFNGSVRTLTIQSDGKILVGGDFSEFDGNTRNYFVRLKQDGTEDTTFYTNLGSGFNNEVLATAVQPDGKILVGGGFTSFNGTTRYRLVRLNPEGTEDTDFYGNLGTSFFVKSAVFSIAIQPDGKILVGGAFDEFDGNTRNYLIRLHPDGTEDTNFYTNLGTGFDERVRVVKVQPDGKILVGGEFSELNGNTRNNLVQLFSDGTEDTSFYTNLGGFNSEVITIENSKRLLVGGRFNELDGNTRNYLVDLTHEVVNFNNTSMDVSNASNTTTGQFTIKGKTQISNTYIDGQAAGLEYKYPIPYSGVNGELAFWGRGEVVEGRLYFLHPSFRWSDAGATSSNATRMLAIAAGTGEANQVGMLLRGHARFPGVTPYGAITSTGAPLFISTTSTEFSETAPTGTGEFVRIIGYVQKADNYQIYFCPDNTWVENI